MLKAKREKNFDSPPHKDLARLPVSIYLTTNYDDFMEHELISIGKEPIMMYPTWHPGLEGFSEQVIGDKEIKPSISRPIVYHLHGHWDVPESILITEDDYINFLSAINNPDLLPIYCRQALLGGPLLFVGYSLRDWNIRVLLKQRSRDQFYPSYAIMPHPKNPGLAKFLEKDLSSRDVYILWGTAQEFTNEFIKRWEVINNSD